jgi:ABC-type lipopolysaccharide export system ATPase subunit
MCAAAKRTAFSGRLPQEASIFRGLNVEDNIRAVLEVVEPDRRKRDHLECGRGMPCRSA